MSCQIISCRVSTSTVLGRGLWHSVWRDRGPEALKILNERRVGNGYVFKLVRFAFDLSESVFRASSTDGSSLYGSEEEARREGPDYHTSFLVVTCSLNIAHSSNQLFLGPAHLQQMANQIGAASGKAGTNHEFDEMAEFDLEAMVDKALSISGNSHLHYVGYSQGTLMMFARLARDRQFGKKIKKFFALAPVGSVAHAKGPIVVIGRDLLPEIELFIKLLGEEEFLPSSVITQFITRAACGASSLTNPLCANLLFALVGPNTNQMNKTRLAAYLSHTPAGTSTQNILHWAQMSRSGRTEMYDYGSESANLRYYGQSTPPQYDLSKVAVPTYLFHSPADLLSDPEDVQYLVRTLPEGTVVDNVELKDFNHIDFVYGLRASTEIYDKIIREIKDHEKNVIRH